MRTTPHLICNFFARPLRCSLVLVFAPVLTAATGCGDGRPDRVPVSGQVTVDGVALTGGYIQFVPADGRPSGGSIDAEGRFTLNCFADQDGAIPGEHRVAVVATEELTPVKRRWLAPKRYADHHTSGLKVSVDQGQDDLQIALTWDGGEPFIETLAAE